MFNFLSLLVSKIEFNRWIVIIRRGCKILRFRATISERNYASLLKRYVLYRGKGPRDPRSIRLDRGKIEPAGIIPGKKETARVFINRSNWDTHGRILSGQVAFLRNVDRSLPTCRAVSIVPRLFRSLPNFKSGFFSTRLCSSPLPLFFSFLFFRSISVCTGKGTIFFPMLKSTWDWIVEVNSIIDFYNR